MVAIKSLVFLLPVFASIASASPINLETRDVYVRDNALVTRSEVAQIVQEALEQRGLFSSKNKPEKDTPEATPVRCLGKSMRGADKVLLAMLPGLGLMDTHSGCTMEPL